MMYILPSVLIIIVYGYILYDIMSYSHRNVQRIIIAGKKTAIIISSVFLIAITIFFVSELSSSGSMTERDTNFWLSGSELILPISALTLVLGIIGEYPDSNSWKKSTLYSVAKLTVILSVAVELLGESGVYVFGNKAHELGQRKIINLNNVATDALSRAADAENKAVSLLSENIELERALAPRENFDTGAIASAMSDAPRIPIHIAPSNQDEPIKVANNILFALTRIHMGSSERWNVDTLGDTEWLNTPGITIQYIREMMARQSTQDKVAVKLCESLKSEGLSASVQPILRVAGIIKSMKIPDDGSIVVCVGEKPNYFWDNKKLARRGLRKIDDQSFCTADEFFEWAKEQQKEHAIRPPAVPNPPKPQPSLQ